MKLEFKNISGQQLEPYLPELAQLRIRVFREFPYLYDGHLDYEMDYLKTYVRSQRSMVVLALHQDQIVGASTCIPLEDEWDDFKSPFLNKGIEISNIYYFGESLLLPEFRGHKAGHKFFELRELHALEVFAALEYTVFCAVDREQNHPLQPEGYRPLDSFWQSKGYYKQSDLVAYTSWKDVDKKEEDKKPLVFWVKKWN